MNLREAIWAAGVIPSDKAERDVKKNYSQALSDHLAVALAHGLRSAGLDSTRPALPVTGAGGVVAKGEGREKAFQGGLGPKKVDVSYSDEEHGLMLGGSIKTICFPSYNKRKDKLGTYSKNLKNRFGDLGGEAVNLHLRFPFAVMVGLFAMPENADRDHDRGETGKSKLMRMSTFRRATKLMAAISRRESYTDPGENYEQIVMLRFSPRTAAHTSPDELTITLIESRTNRVFTEQEYYESVLEVFTVRNPHLFILDEDDGE